jgi:hypothetical protein
VAYLEGTEFAKGTMELMDGRQQSFLGLHSTVLIERPTTLSTSVPFNFQGGRSGETEVSGGDMRLDSGIIRDRRRSVKDRSECSNTLTFGLATTPPT